MDALRGRGCLDHGARSLTARQKPAGLFLDGFAVGVSGYPLLGLAHGEFDTVPGKLGASRRWAAQAAQLSLGQYLVSGCRLVQGRSEPFHRLR